MILFQFSAWPGGPNLLSAGLYNLRGWHTVLLFPFDRHAIPVRLPVRARMYR